MVDFMSCSHDEFVEALGLVKDKKFDKMTERQLRIAMTKYEFDAMQSGGHGTAYSKRCEGLSSRLARRCRSELEARCRTAE